MIHNRKYQHPERSHLLKYFPKYYQNLTLEITKENHFLSKVKRIKKLKRFTGYFKEKLPSKLWLNLLRNNRKEIEEIPKIIPNRENFRPDNLYWERLSLWKARLFPHITKLVFSGKSDDLKSDFDHASLVNRPLRKYFRNMRKIKVVRVILDEANDKGEKWMPEELSELSAFLEQLKAIDMTRDFFKSKRAVSHITGLTFDWSLETFDPKLIMIPKICQNLRFLSIGFDRSEDESPEFLKFLTSIQSLHGLVGLELGFLKGIKHFLSYFKPQSSLRHLRLQIYLPDLIIENGFHEGLLSHWEDIKELDILELDISCDEAESIPFLRSFITLILKKIRKVDSLKCIIDGDMEQNFLDEPFYVEDVPHLYESLQSFEYTHQNSFTEDFLGFRMKKLGFFKNLRSIKLEGNRIEEESIEEMVGLLERNQKQGDYPLLEIKLGSIKISSGWLKSVLERIQKTKDLNKNLKIVIDLSFRVGHPGQNEFSLLDNLCNIIVSAGFIKGVLVHLTFLDSDGRFSLKNFRKMIEKYGEIKNLLVDMHYFGETFHYMKMDGEKDQLVVENRRRY